MIVVGFGPNIASEVFRYIIPLVMFVFVFLAGYVLMLGYMHRHGRRLAWNRIQWDSFDAFQRSEQKWKPWGWVGVVFIALSFVVPTTIGFMDPSLLKGASLFT